MIKPLLFCGALLLSTGSFLFSEPVILSPLSFDSDPTGGSLDVVGNVNASLTSDLSVENESDVVFAKTFTTAGPIRPGFVATSTFDHAIGVVPTTYSFYGLSQYFNYPRDTVYLPFDLGREFVVVVVGKLGTVGYDYGAFYDYHLFEVDGITPVAVTEVSAAPEPGSFGLLLIPSLAAALTVRRRAG